MSFVDRSYPDLVADLLTLLTQGVAQEVHRVSYDPEAEPPELPEVVLRKRPVRRVSLVRGFLTAPGGEEEARLHTFGLNDYELLPSPDDPEDLSTLRFLPFGNKPAPDTDLMVNYYPRDTDPTPLTDVNVGSVTRTVVEAISRELAGFYEQLNLAYDSAFVETATGPALDRVVALLGYRRFKAGRPVGTVRFDRRPGLSGTISIPPGVPITDSEDKVRYETVEARTMLAGESTAEVRVRGVAADTAVVEAGVLTVLQRAVAGVDSVANDRPTSRAVEDETDDELRRRARSALLASNKGTLDALRNGLLAMPEVRDVQIEEHPNDVPGEVKLFLSLEETAGTAVPPSVKARIEELRAAGIRVLDPAVATPVALQANVSLVLAGSHLPAAELEQVHQAVKTTLIDKVRATAVGQQIRVRPLIAAILADDRVVDATVAIGESGQTPQPNADFAPPTGSVTELTAQNVTFGPDAFEETAASPAVEVEVQALMTATPVTGTTPAEVESGITGKLKTYFAGLAAGDEITDATLLDAVREDGRWQVDPATLRVTLLAGEQFVQILQGGPSFTVLAGQTFEVTTVEVAG